MSKDLITCSPEDALEDAIDRMMRHQVRRIYVVDSASTLAGVISQADVASRSGDRIQTAQLVERVSQPGVPEPVPGGLGAR
jgi:CBS domain-containing protein